jgi:hypothetical protein
MSKLSNAFSTHQARANREDLEGTIYNIDPAETPIFTMAGKRSASNVIYTWQTEKLPGLNTNNRKPEGFIFGRRLGNKTVRVSNVVQISTTDATVTGTQQASNPAGKPGGEMAHQMAIAAKAFKRDLEAIAAGPQPRIDGTEVDEEHGEDDEDARQTRGFEHWITSNVDYGAGGKNGADQYSPLVDGTVRDFTEDMLSDVLQMAYDNGAEPTELLLGSYAKRIFSTFRGRAETVVNVGQREAVNTIDVYKSDFGNIKARPSRFHRQRTALILDPSMLKIAYFRRMFTTAPAKVADAETKTIIAEWGTHVGNEAAHAKIADLPYSKATDPVVDRFKFRRGQTTTA